MSKVLKFESELLESNQVTPSVKILRFSAPEEFEFIPGQFVTLLVKVNDKVERRSYSISHSGRGYIETSVDLVENGRVSPTLHKIKKGEKMTVQGPLGVFILKPEAINKDNIFIATGTGITPFVSMIPYLLKNTNKKVTLLAGYKHEDEVIYGEFFRGLKSTYGNFAYHPIISRPKDNNFKGEKGRVQSLIEKHVSGKFTGDFYLCGLFEMIKDVGVLLASKGVNKERIIFERYD